MNVTRPHEGFLHTVQTWSVPLQTRYLPAQIGGSKSVLLPLCNVSTTGGCCLATLVSAAQANCIVLLCCKVRIIRATQPSLGCAVGGLSSIASVCLLWRSCFMSERRIHSLAESLYVYELDPDLLVDDAAGGNDASVLELDDGGSLAGIG